MQDHNDSEYRPAGPDAIVGWLVFAAALIATLVGGYRIGLPKWQTEIACLGIMLVFALGSVIYDRFVRPLKISVAEFFVLICAVMGIGYYLVGRAVWMVLT